MKNTAPFTMTLRSSTRNQAQGKDTFHELGNGVYARPAATDARKGPANAKKTTRTPKPAPLKHASAQIIEDIFGGELSPVTESEDEDDSGGEFFSFSSEEPESNAETEPSSPDEVATAYRHLTGPYRLGRRSSRALITPENSIAALPLIVPAAPKKRQHPYPQDRRNNLLFTPSGNGKQKLEDYPLNGSWHKQSWFKCGDESAASSSARDAAAHKQSSRGKPVVSSADEIFRRELYRLSYAANRAREFFLQEAEREQQSPRNRVRFMGPNDSDILCDNDGVLVGPNCTDIDEDGYMAMNDRAWTTLHWHEGDSQSEAVLSHGASAVDSE